MERFEMKLCFDCIGEDVYTNDFSLSTGNTHEGAKMLMLKTNIGEHTLGVYKSDTDFNRALNDVQNKIEMAFRGEYGDGIVHIFAKETYVTRRVTSHVAVY